VFGLAVLNLLALAGGVANMIRTGQPGSLPEFNAEKIQIRERPTRAAPVRSDRAGSLLSENLQCLGMAGIEQGRFESLRASLAELALGVEACQFILPQRLGWWVFWPPVYEAAERERVNQALRAAGVRDVQPIRSGGMAQAYSLGAFQFESQAVAMRDELRQKGLGAVQYGPRPAEGEVLLLCRIEDPELRRRMLAVLPPEVKPRPVGQCRMQTGPEGTEPAAGESG